MFRNSLQDIGLDAADGSTFAMTALGQTRPSGAIPNMSAKGSRADMCIRAGQVAEVPIEEAVLARGSNDLQSVAPF
jgi:hypothetical protein